jgi:DNA-binding NarL/FixJ family response regulator
MINVMLVDDHASLRQAIAFLVDREPDLQVVAGAGSLAEARALLKTTTIDVLLLDMELPDGMGTDLLPELFRHSPGASQVVLSGSHLPHNRARSIAAGAVGFLHKSLGVPEIVEAIRKAARGEPLIPAVEAMALMREANQYERSREAVQRRLDLLTPREMDVLNALARGHDNQTIADELHLTTATVRSHVAHLLRKLDVDSRLQAALIAVEHRTGSAGNGS